MENIGKRVYVKTKIVSFDNEGMINWISSHELQNAMELDIFRTEQTVWKPGIIKAIRVNTYGVTEYVIELQDGEMVSENLELLYFEDPAAGGNDND